MLKQVKVLVFVGLLVALLQGTASAYDSIYKAVAINDNGERTTLRTTSNTVGELLKNEGLKIVDKDKVNVDLQAEIYPGLEVVIDRGVTVTAVIDGVGRSSKVSKGTKVGNFIASLPKKESMEYVYNGSYDEDLVEDKKLDLSVKTKQREVTKAPIPFESITEDSAEVFVDEQEVFTEGVLGEKEITTEITFVNGEEVERNVILETVIAEPVTEVIHNGTKLRPQTVSTDTGVFEYSQVIEMEATAYTNSYEDTGKNPSDKYYGITASGMVARVGVVAVDPRVVPLGTKLYVEGYGYCIAGDTGGAIKGNKIDLFFNTKNECYNFGRRKVTVYVLKDQ